MITRCTLFHINIKNTEKQLFNDSKDEQGNVIGFQSRKIIPKKRKSLILNEVLRYEISKKNNKIVSLKYEKLPS